MDTPLPINSPPSQTTELLEALGRIQRASPEPDDRRQDMLAELCDLVDARGAILAEADSGTNGPACRLTAAWEFGEVDDHCREQLVCNLTCTGGCHARGDCDISREHGGCPAAVSVLRSRELGVAGMLGVFRAADDPPFEDDDRRLVERLHEESDWICGHLSTGRKDPLRQLTPRQREIVELLAEGKAEGEIARTVHRSPHTIHDHVKAIYATLGVHSRSELLAFLHHREGPRDAPTPRHDPMGPPPAQTDA